MTFKVVAFTQAYCNEAAELAAQRGADLMRITPALPPLCCDPATFLPQIQDLAQRVPGVAALRNGRLCGYWLAFVIPEFRGLRSAYSPDWANGADTDEAAAIYQAMYAHLSPTWLANGCFLHLASVNASARAALDGLYWQGFGLNVIDSIRDLTSLARAAPLAQPVEQLVIRRATPDDVDAVLGLSNALQRHLAAPPIYLALNHLESRTDIVEWLSEPGNAKWLALLEGELVAEMGFAPANQWVSSLIRTQSTISIVSAYTRPEARKHGLGARLLDHGLAMARDAGFAHCAVDFESANTEGARFWMRHFQPFCFSVMRYVDQRMGWAHAQRDAGHMW
jgi:GNAT superfamily N-acetyltransferase